MELLFNNLLIFVISQKMRQFDVISSRLSRFRASHARISINPKILSCVYI
jgi:hypothetical protein